jgi:hypothetical protein
MQAIKQYLQSVTDNEDFIDGVPDEVYDAIVHELEGYGKRLVKSMKNPRFNKEDTDSCSDSRMYEDEFYDYKHGKGDFFVWVEYHYPTSGHYGVRSPKTIEELIELAVRSVVAELAQSDWYGGIEQHLEGLVATAVADPEAKALATRCFDDGVHDGLQKEHYRLKDQIDDAIWQHLDEDGRSTFTPYDGGEELEAVLEWQSRPIFAISISDESKVTPLQSGGMSVTVPFKVRCKRVRFNTDYDWEKDW